MFTAEAGPTMRRVLVLAALVVLGACGDQQPTEPIKPAAGGSLSGLLSSTANLVECRTDETVTSSGSITEAGGSLAIGGTIVVFPPGAVLGATNFTLTIPASKYVEVQIRATGHEYFDFQEGSPAVVTIDYSRCNRSDVLVKPLSVWYINSEKEPETNMGGVDNKLTRSITFTTPHLSGYAIAF
jgi:hypothetical protein